MQVIVEYGYGSVMQFWEFFLQVPLRVVSTAAMRILGPITE